MKAEYILTEIFTLISSWLMSSVTEAANLHRKYEFQGNVQNKDFITHQALEQVTDIPNNRVT